MLCVFTGFREKMCDVIEKLVLLCHCGRISNTGRELTSAIPLLSCVCVCVPKPLSRHSRLSVLLRFLQHDLTSGLTVILLREVSVGEQVTLSCKFLSC